MFIDIRKISEGNSSADIMLSFSEELQSAGKVQGDFPAVVSIQRYGGYLFVKIEYTCEVTLECGRCLESFREEVTGTVEFTLQSSLEEDVSGGENDVYTFIAEDDVIDFEQSVYDDMMVRVSVQPICDPSCKGFDDQQLVDTAPEEPATETVVDARWAALSKLKK